MPVATKIINALNRCVDPISVENGVSGNTLRSIN